MSAPLSLGIADRLARARRQQVAARDPAETDRWAEIVEVERKAFDRMLESAGIPPEYFRGGYSV